MESISFYFFPDSETKFLAVLCYLLILLTAYKRFNALAANYQTFDAPETARPWTTWLRYHAAAAIYFCLFAGLFATVYNLIHRYPSLIDLAVNYFGINAQWEKVPAQVKAESSLVVPLLSLILLTWGVQKIPWISSWDCKMRLFFQRLGSIPIRVSNTINLMRRSEIEIEESDCLEHLPEDIKRQVRSAGRQKDSNSLEGLYLRTCLLHQKLAEWDNKGSRFFDFRSVYDRQFTFIKSRLDTIKRDAKRYYSLRWNFQPEAGSVELPPNRTGTGQMSGNYPKLMKEIKSDVRHELKALLESIYTFIACAVHTEGLSERSRRKYLQEFGFRLPPAGSVKSPIDPNDLTVLAFFLIFVVPAAAVICNMIDQGAVLDHSYTIFVVWSLMALFIGLSSVVPALIVKQALEYSDKIPWKHIRSRHGRPCSAYLISGFLAAVIGASGLSLLSYLNPKYWNMEPVEIFLKMAPWSLVSAGIAIVVGFHLDTQDSKRKSQRIFELASTAAASVLAATIALFISRGSFTLDVFMEGLRFPLPAAAFLGAAVGGVVPFRYRSHLDHRSAVIRSRVPIKNLLEECIDELSNTAKEEGVKIRTRLAPDLPEMNIDQNKMRLAIHSLLLNAIEFTQEGGEVLVEIGQSDSGALSFKISDNGIGMAEKTLQKATALPKGADRELMEYVNGQDSVNLKQIRRIIENHGGQFFVDSKAGEGTEASFVLSNYAAVEPRTT